MRNLAKVKVGKTNRRKDLSFIIYHLSFFWAKLNGKWKMLNGKLSFLKIFFSIKNFFKRKPFFVYLTLFAVSFLFFTWLQATPMFADPDSFYHVKLTMMMQEKLEQGEFPIIKDFPWLQFTTLKENYTDHHFLYHLLLLPFVKYYDPILGAKLFTIILCSGIITLFYWLLKKFNISQPLILTLLLFSSAGFIFRISLIKAQAMALIIFFLMLWAILTRKYLFVFVLAAIYVWAYDGWILALVITIFYIIPDAVSKLLRKIPKFNLSFIIKLFFTKENALLLLTVLLGLTFGIIANPWFPQNLSFFWQHIFQIGLINEKTNISIGAEWYAPDFTDFFLQNILILTGWLIAVAWFLSTAKFQSKKSWVLFFLSVSFLFLAVRSKRHIEYFVPLAVMFSSFAFAANPFSNQGIEWKILFQKLKSFIISPNPLTTILVTGYLITALLICGVNFSEQLNFVQEALANRFYPHYLEKASLWLEKNTPQGVTIFHSSWDEFPFLFYHNTHNYYIVGLDATFMYNYDKFLYQLWRDITTGKDQAWLAYKIKNKFGSKYVLVTKKKHEKFEKILEHDDNFESVYEDEEARVFRITN